MSEVTKGLLLASTAAGGGAGPSGPYDGVALSTRTASTSPKAFRLTHGVGWGSEITTPVFSSTSFPRDMDFNPSTGASVVFSDSSTVGGASAYAWDNATGFGAKYSNPTTAGNSGYGIKFTNSGSHVLVSNATSPYLRAWVWDDATGFGSISSPSPAPPNDSFSNYFILCALDDSAVIYNNFTSPYYLSAYAFSPVSGFGSAYSNPASAVAGFPREGAFSPDGLAVAFAHDTSPYLTVYAWSSSTGFGAKYTSPSLSITRGQGVSWTRTGAAIILVGENIRRAWAWNSSTGFGSQYSDPSAYTSAGLQVFVANTNDMIFMTGSSYALNIQAYEWDDTTGWGTYYSSPQGGWNGNGFGALSLSS